MTAAETIPATAMQPIRIAAVFSLFPAVFFFSVFSGRLFPFFFMTVLQYALQRIPLDSKTAVFLLGGSASSNDGEYSLPTERYFAPVSRL